MANVYRASNVGQAEGNKKMRARALVCIVLSFGTARLAAAQQETVPSESLVEFPAGSPVELGEGWNVERQTGTKVRCIDFLETRGTFVDIQQIRLSRAVDKETLHMSLNSGLSADLTLPIGKAGGSTKFAYGQTLGSDSLAIVIDGTALAAPRVVSPKPNPSGSGAAVSLSDDGQKALARGADAFLKTCGDSFVSVINEGSRVTGRYEIKNASRSERIKYDNSLEGGIKVGNAGVSFNAQLAAELNADRESNRVNVFYIAYGASDTAGIDEPSFLQALKDLPVTARKYPRPFTMKIQSYQSLGTWAGSIPLQRSSPASNLTRTILELDALREAIVSIGSSSDYVLVFDTDRSSLNALENEIVGKRAKLADALAKCLDEKGCDDSLAKGFDDYEMRARLPVKVPLSDLSPGADVHVLISNLAIERWNKWIIDPANLRCRYRFPIDCITEETKRKWLTQIERNIRASIGESPGL